VQVAGRVVRSETGAFVLESEGARLLIVPQSDFDETYEIGTTVLAGGTIERLLARDEPAILGEEDLFEDFEGQPTLAATEVTVIEQ
jgi:hypothetical protein